LFGILWSEVLAAKKKSLDPLIVAKLKVPDPLVCNACPDEPSAFGKVKPSKTIFPEPLGVIVILPFAASVIVIVPELVPELVSKTKS